MRRSGALDKAIADFNAAIQTYPKCASAYHNRGLTHQRKGEMAKVEADFALRKETRV